VDKFFLHFLICFNSALKGILKEICHKKSSKNQGNYSANFGAKLKLNLAFGLPTSEGNSKKP
jgi:hypothetical protein